nr:uncharacterized protein LOC109733296 [Aegilops tauschii subsp. strangulata]
MRRRGREGGAEGGDKRYWAHEREQVRWRGSRPAQPRRDRQMQAGAAAERGALRACTRPKGERGKRQGAAGEESSRARGAVSGEGVRRAPERASYGSGRGARCVLRQGGRRQRGARTRVGGVQQGGRRRGEGGRGLTSGVGDWADGAWGGRRGRFDAGAEAAMTSGEVAIRAAASSVEARSWVRQVRDGAGVR